MVDMGGEAAAVPSLSRVPRLSFIPWLRLFHSLTHSLTLVCRAAVTRPAWRWLLREAGQPRWQPFCSSPISTLVVHMLTVFAVRGGTVVVNLAG